MPKNFTFHYFFKHRIEDCLQEVRSGSLEALGELEEYCYFDLVLSSAVKRLRDSAFSIGDQIPAEIGGLDEQRLVQSLRAGMESGAQEAWEKFVWMFSEPVVKVLARYFRQDREIVNDLTQTVWIAIHEKPSSAFESEQFKPSTFLGVANLLKGIAAHKAMDEFRRRSREPADQFDLDESGADVIPAESRLIPKEQSSEENARIIDQAINRLKDEEKLVVLYKWAGLKEPEIASVMGLTLNQVKKEWRKARDGFKLIFGNRVPM